MFGGSTFGGAPFAGVVVGVFVPPPPPSSTAGVTLDGADISRRARMAGATIRDVLNDSANTAALKIEGGAFVSGRLAITLNNGAIVLFSGALQQVGKLYEGGRPNLPIWNCSATDRVPVRRPFGAYASVSASTVAADLAARFAPGFTTAIEPNLPAVSMTFDGSERFLTALVRLATLVGGYAKIDDGVVRLFLEDLANGPDPLDLAHRPLNDPPLTRSQDVSQIRTRVYGKGYGENVPADVLAGETILPITNGAGFNPAGGRALAGTTADGAQSQQITYSGVSRPVGGTLVGTGAGPANRVTLDLGAGTGVDSGIHEVAVVYVTPAGKSLPGPSASITVGLLSGPTAAPVAGAPTVGAGVTSGSHQVAVSFVTAAGETPAGPLSNPVTAGSQSGGFIDAPNGSQMVATPSHALGNVSEPIVYGLTYTNSVGETTSNGGPILQVKSWHPTNLNVDAVNVGAGNLQPGQYGWWMSVVTATGESEGQRLASVSFGQVCNARLRFTAIQSELPGIVKYRFFRTFKNDSNGTAWFIGEVNSPSVSEFIDSTPDGSLGGANPPAVNTTYPTVNLSNIPTGPAAVTSRKVYADTRAGTVLGLLLTVGGNTATTASHNAADDTRGAAPPSTNTTATTTAFNVIPVTGIPIGGPLVTGRRLWMTPAGGGGLRLASTIGPSGSTASITTPDGSLGGSPPALSTATANQVAVSDIPRGPSTVTARELYMTLGPGAGGPLRLALTIADNTTVAATITIGNAALVNQPLAPLDDRSGLSQPAGQVNAGATSMPFASIEPLDAGGGWIVAGQQVIRYAGLSGQSAIGIPVNGPGAIVTTVLYGQQATPAPVLLGVNGLALRMDRGAAVHVFVQRDDLVAQAEEAARAGGDGVVEYLLSDARRSEASLIARCDAELALFSRPIITVTYATRDPKTKSGKSITINLPGYPVETLTIQEVQITEIDVAKNTMPRFTVTASSVRFSLEAMLRRLAQPQ